MKKVISFLNQKGGVGKTTSAFEIGYLLAHRHKKKVLLIDFDAQCNLTSGAGLDITERNKMNIFDAISGREMVVNTIVKLDYNLHIIPGSRKMLSQYFVGVEDIDLLRLILEYVEGYDYVLVDVGPDAGSLMQMAMLASDYIVAVAQCSRYAYEGIEQLYTDLERGKSIYANFNPTVIGLLLMSSKKTNVAKHNLEKFKDIGEKMGALPFKQVVRFSCLADECKEFGLSINKYKESSGLARDYREVTRELLQRIADCEG